MVSRESCCSQLNLTILKNKCPWLIQLFRINTLSEPSEKKNELKLNSENRLQIEGWAQDYSNWNIFLKPLFRGNLDPFVNNANLGAIAHTSNGT